MGDMLSQDEINALLGNVPESGDDFKLTAEQSDVLGEIGNISMGTAATTLFKLLNQRVTITTPKVKIFTYDEMLTGYAMPCVATRVDYKIGITGTNVLILSRKDVKIITSLMMGQDGIDIDEETPLSDIDLSAIGEAMNQMIGSASTSLSSMIKQKVDIDTPSAFEILLDDPEDLTRKLGVSGEELIVTVTFRITIGDLIDSELVQVLTPKFAIELINTVKAVEEEKLKMELKKEAPLAESNESSIKEPTVETQPQMQTQTQTQPQPQMQPQQSINTQSQKSSSNIYNEPNINVQQAQFQNFDVSEVMQQKENIEIIMDVQLGVTVELGRTSKTIKDILEFSPGTIIELNKLAGEPVDILVNGKFIANGEVVVIDENFGIRITDIIGVENRI